jgi:AcrR family transcriptional regulator
MNAYKQKWIVKALESLKEVGHYNLSINEIAESLNLSRGSFYHHFKNTSEFYDEVLAYWLNLGTEKIWEMELNNDSLSEIKRLQKFAWNLDHSLDLEIRAWALHDPKAKHYLTQADQNRLKYMQSVYASFYNLSQDNAKIISLTEISYISFLGAQSAAFSLPGFNINEYQTNLSNILSTLFKYTF